MQILWDGWSMAEPTWPSLPMQLCERPAPALFVHAWAYFSDACMPCGPTGWLAGWPAGGGACSPPDLWPVFSRARWLWSLSLPCGPREARDYVCSSRARGRSRPKLNLERCKRKNAYSVLRRGDALLGPCWAPGLLTIENFLKIWCATASPSQVA